MRIPTFFGLLQRAQHRIAGPLTRSLGQSLLRLSQAIAKDTVAITRMQPNPNSVKVGDKEPNLQNFKFVGRNSVLAGNIRTEPGSQVFFNSVLRTSDGGKIELGKSVYVKDHVIIKADGGKTVSIGKASIISSHAYLHNCKIGRGGFVGPKATVSEGCEIEDYGGVAAGSVLPPNAKVQTRQFWAGSPAKYLRDITDEEVEYFKEVQANYDKLGFIIADEVKKPFEETFYHIKDVNKEIEDDPKDQEDQTTRLNELARDLKIAITDEDVRRNEVRSAKQEVLTLIGSENPEMLYDGNRDSNPKYIGEYNKDFKLENDLKRKLEFDPEAKRMKHEDFDKDRLQVSDREFKRKF